MIHFVVSDKRVLTKVLLLAFNTETWVVHILVNIDKNSGNLDLNGNQKENCQNSPCLAAISPIRHVKSSPKERNIFLM